MHPGFRTLREQVLGMDEAQLDVYAETSATLELQSLQFEGLGSTISQAEIKASLLESYRALRGDLPR